ncbi:MAG: DUF1570 domain-containing protein [Pirellulaceae bacterium]
MHRHLASAVLLAITGAVLPATVLPVAVLPATAADFMVQLDLDGRTIEGSPITWNSGTVAFLRRDGEVLTFAPEQAQNFRQTAPQFRGYSPAEMRAQLLHEFGREFDVSGTGQYLVVHPKGKRDLWAGRFEELYRSFVHYFTVRGVATDSPQFPLVAIVFYNKQDFLRYSAQHGVRLPSNVLGYYSRATNRILMYDPDAGQGNDNWQQAAETIIHEAAHQSAFNTGVHSRYTSPPVWLAEGLGTLFEAPGVWNSRLYPRREDRINHARLDAFRRYDASRKPGWLAQMLAHDWAFQRTPDEAYAAAWAVTFFLAETRPRQFAEYLRKTAEKEPFSEISAPQREQDFRDVFGENLALLEMEAKRFIDQLP